MKRKSSVFVVVWAVMFLAFISGVSAQNVNREELEKNQSAVNFINYEGPHARIDTIEQIRNIGYSLGLAIKNGATRAGAQNRYFVIHCSAGPEGNKFDADVFGLGIDVGVDHVRNLRLIIQGYLQGAYDYSAADAALLSRYVTIYNAVFRGDWNFFNTRYKNIVIQNLTAEKAGASIRYDEWPGQTLMTIPLGTGSPGSLSAIDTSGLTDPGVIDSMRTGEDRGIDDRRGMVDLKEREADEASQRAALQREAIAEEERKMRQAQEENRLAQQRLEQERQQAQQREEQARRQAEQARQQAEQARQQAQAGAITPEESQRRQQEAQQQAEQAQQQAQQAREQQDSLAAEQQANDQQLQQDMAQKEAEQEQRRQAADAAQQLADQKTQEAQQERQEIAKDQQEMIKGGPAIASAGQGQQAAAAPKITGLLAAGILQANTPLGRLLRLDPTNGSAVQTSQMTTVNTRTVNLSGTRIFAIAGVNQGNAAIRLVEIDNDTLNMLKQGDDDIYQNSLLWVNGSNLYAITVVNGKNYMARFDLNLAKQAQSTVEVHPYASCLFQGDKVLTQKTDGTPLLLNGQTLN